MQPARTYLWIAAIIAGCGSSNNGGTGSDAGTGEDTGPNGDDGEVIPPNEAGVLDGPIFPDASPANCTSGPGVTALYSGTTAAWLALDDQWIYWVSPYQVTPQDSEMRIWRAPAGGGATASGFGGAGNPTAIATDGTYVYWIDANTTTKTTSLLRRAVSGTADETFATRSDPDASGTAQLFAALALEPSSLVIAAETEVIRFASNDASAPSLVASALATSVATDHGAVAFASYFGVGVVPSVGASTTPLTSDVDYSRGKIVMDANNAYWLGSAGITAAPLSGAGTPTPIAQGAVALAVAAGQLYYATYDDQNKSSTVLRIRTGGAVDVLVTRKGKITDVAVSGTTLAWAEEEGQVVCVERKSL
jgi:hypothetical protein